MSIRAVMALTLVAVGILILCIVFIDWTPDVTPEEMFGTRARPKLPPEAMEAMRSAMEGRPNSQQAQARGIADVQADVNQAAKLAAADTPQAATELVALLHRYAPSPTDRFQAARQPDLQQANQQAREAITDLIADSENPHIFDALAKSLDNWDDRGYVMLVCQTLARRQDKGSLPLVWWRLKQLRGSTDEYQAIVAAMASYPHEHLLSLLDPVVKNPQSLDRYAAYDVLAALGTHQSAEQLVAIFGTPTSGDPQLTEALVAIGTPAIEPLIAAMDSDNVGVRRSAMDALSKIDDPVVGNVMIEALGSDDAFIAQAARNWVYRQSRQTASGKTLPRGHLLPNSDRRRKTLDMLIRASRHDDPAVRKAAVEALGGWDGPEAVGALLMACLDKDKKVSEEACIKIAGVKSGNTQPARNLAQAIQASDAGKKAMTAGGLNKLSDDELTSLLIAAMQPGTPYRREASRTLSRLHTPKATQALIEALTDSQENVSANARMGLWDRLTVEDIASLEPARKSEYVHTRRNAVNLLRHIGTEAIVEPMLDTLKNETDEQTYEMAGSAVFRMEDPRLVWPLFDWVTKHGHHNPGLPGKKPRGPYTWFYRIPDVVRNAVLENPAPFIERLTDDTSDDRRALAAELLRLSDQPDAKDALRKRIAGGDVVVLQHAHDAFTKDELLACKEVLIRGMNSRLALRFEHCDDPDVQQAAKEKMPAVRVIYIPVFR